MPSCSFFFFNDTATTEIYTLSLHDALPIYYEKPIRINDKPVGEGPSTAQIFPTVLSPARGSRRWGIFERLDRKSTRLNSSHQIISYAVFCLKKKKKRDHTSAANATQQVKAP